MSLIRRRGKPYSIYTHVPGKGKKLKKGVTVLKTCKEDQQEASSGITPDSLLLPKLDTQNHVVQPEFTADDSKVHVEPSAYNKAKSKRCENWENLRPQLLSAFISTEEPSSSICYSCGQLVSDLYRCLDCGVWMNNCLQCTRWKHSHPHLHTVEKWMVCTLVLIVHSI